MRTLFQSTVTRPSEYAAHQVRFLARLVAQLAAVPERHAGCDSPGSGSRISCSHEDREIGEGARECTRTNDGASSVGMSWLGSARNSQLAGLTNGPCQKRSPRACRVLNRLSGIPIRRKRLVCAPLLARGELGTGTLFHPHGGRLGCIMNDDGQHMATR